MRGKDVLAPFDIRNGTGDLQYPMIRPCAEFEERKRLFHQFLALVVQHAVFFHLTGGKLCVEQHPFPFVAFTLTLSRGGESFRVNVKVGGEE